MNHNPQMYPPGYPPHMRMAPGMPQGMSFPGQNGVPPGIQMRPPNMAFHPNFQPAVRPQPQPQNRPNLEQDAGDELDDISARDIAMARYKRNHDYLSEIFTPYSASSITPPSLEHVRTKEELERQIEECETKTKEQQENHVQRMKELRQARDQFWTSLNDLKEATTVDAIDKVSLGQRHVKHHEGNVRSIPIPGLKEEPEERSNQRQDQQDALMVNSDFQDDSAYNASDAQDDNNDFMFNEMVNTDDDPSVSEFLNTSDMDFDPPEDQ